MTAKDLNNFLKALEAVKQDTSCGVCHNICEEPVTLSKCFHVICASHFDGLDNCPTCNISIRGDKYCSDDRMKKCYESTKELTKIFECFRYEELRSSRANSSIAEQKHRESKENITPKHKFTKPNDKNKSIPSDKQIPQKSHKDKTLDISLPSDISASRINKIIEKKNNKGETMLHIACRLGKTDKVLELLTQGANTNTKDNAGWTPLHEAVQNNNIELVKILLQYNTLIDVPGQDNETPLHEAVRYNNEEIAVALVKNGADVNVRNCKGETPLQLANDKMKTILETAAENILQTQSINIHHISSLQAELDFDDIRVYCVSEYRTVQNKLKLMSKHHSNLHVESKLTKKVTHILVETDDNGICQSSVDIFQGIVSAIWILSTNWILKSTEKKLEPFETHEVKGVSATSYNGPRNARYNKYKQLPGIFNGCHFYLHNFNTKYEISKVVITKAILTKLITDAGGVVLRRVPNPESIPDSEKLVPYHAKKDSKLIICSHYIIFKDMYEPMYNMKHLKALPIGWLIECIEKYELCEPWPLGN